MNTTQGDSASVLTNLSKNNKITGQSRAAFLSLASAAPTTSVLMSLRSLSEIRTSMGKGELTAEILRPWGHLVNKHSFRAQDCASQSEDKAGILER